VVPFDRRSAWGAIECVQRLRENRYTCAIDFQGLYKSSVLAGLSGAPRRIGFERAWAREGGAAMFYTERVVPAGRHVAELNYSLAEQAGASRPAAPEYPLRIPAGGAASVRSRLQDLGITGEYMVVGPGGSWRAKCWPTERFGELCREIEQRTSLRVVVIHGPGERAAADEVLRAAAPAQPVIVPTTIEELIGLLSHARCLIAVDSGPLHLAAALGTPVVGLFGPTDPARNGPFAPRAIVVHKALPEEISYKRRAEYSPSMLRIAVPDVLAAAEPLLKVSA
jgi:ADP-heptose:LPS heptosyltransferase